jgi:cellulose synthase/poly-beta-1,6-N-acetylglucosamine synthase-like glycosyltransferase
MINTYGSLALGVLSLLLAVQGIVTLYLMLYTWMRPDRLEQARSPKNFAEPTLKFTALLPARHEQEVIAHTINRVCSTTYPTELIEVVVICEAGDTETIAEAARVARSITHTNVRVVTFNDGPINKPHGLNVGFRASSFEVVTIFDAEDDVHPEIFDVVNTIMLDEDAGIVQAGVQLMDFRSSWYAPHNVLEYFFWFKSRLHFHAQVGSVPLGGNTVFMKRNLIEAAGGWDENCLTEDADIGMRMSALGEPIAITYDHEHATREETPPSIGNFIRQRTRWNQGFLQVVRNGDWRRLETRNQRLLAAYTLLYPIVQASLAILWLPALITTITLKAPIFIALLSLAPFYFLAFKYIVDLVGLSEFCRSYDFKLRPRDIVVFTLGFLPYQMLLNVSALRAVVRHIRGTSNWEKTAHTGAHRAASDRFKPQREPALMRADLIKSQDAIGDIADD